MQAQRAVCVLVLAGVVTAVWSQGPEPDRSRPEAVAKAYLEALAKGDGEAALRCLDPATEGRGAGKLLKDVAGKGASMEQMLTEVLLLPVGTQVQYEGGELVRDGDSARLAVMATLALPQTLVLRKAADGTWFVDLTQSAKASTGLEQPLVLRDLARPAPDDCMSHLKQLALAVLMWAADHGDTLPPAKSWGSELQPYLRDLKVCRCPAAPDLACGYSYNLEVAGRKLASIQRPAETVLFYESGLGSLDAADRGESQPRPGRHNGGTNRAFVDGHVQFVPATKP